MSDDRRDDRPMLFQAEPAAWFETFTAGEVTLTRKRVADALCDIEDADEDFGATTAMNLTDAAMRALADRVAANEDMPFVLRGEDALSDVIWMEFGALVQEAWDNGQDPA